MREIVLRRIEDSLAVRAEASERDAECVAQVVGGRLGIVVGFVRRERFVLGAINDDLSPYLRETPGRRSGSDKFDGSLSAGFMTIKALLNPFPDRSNVFDRQ